VRQFSGTERLLSISGFPVKEIGSWDQLLAGFGGMLKDAAGDAGMEVESPIFERRDFEQLEMKGQIHMPPSGFQQYHQPPAA